MVVTNCPRCGAAVSTEATACGACGYSPGAAQMVPQVFAPQVYVAPQAPAGVWTCPFCRYQGPPIIAKKISTGGWIVFAILLFVCFLFCWVGLLMTEDYRRCPQCKTKI